MKFDFDNYWKTTLPSFESLLKSNQDVEVNQFLKKGFAFICHSTEDSFDKAQKNREIQSNLNSILLQTMDLGRGIIVNQQLLLLTQSALVYRTLFEIYCNLLLITKAKDPSCEAKRFLDFGRYEELYGRQKLKFLKPPNQNEIENILSDYPEWKSKDPNLSELKFKSLRHWGIKNQTLEDIAKDLKLTSEYETVYKSCSKYSHCSSVVTKMYIRENKLYPVADLNKLVNINAPAMIMTLKIIVEYLLFFKIPFSSSDYKKIVDSFISIAARYKN